MAFWGVSEECFGAFWGVPQQCFEGVWGLSEGLGALRRCFRTVFLGVSGAFGAFQDVLEHFRASWSCTGGI